jgi:midasin
VFIDGADCGSEQRHLRGLARAVVFRKCPVLLQGPTSCGKTTMVEYLAALTQHKVVRINNHEHTDLSEYLGSYVTNEAGELVSGPLLSVGCFVAVM